MPALDAADRSLRRSRSRSDCASVRNPLLSLPAFRELALLPRDDQRVLRQLLIQIRHDAAARAEHAWARKKGPMAAYWRAVSVYAYHASRAFTRPGQHRRGIADDGGCRDASAFHD